MPPFIRCLAIILASLGCVPLRAQENPAGTPPPPVNVQFRLLAWSANISPLYYGANQKIDATENNCRSAIQTYSGPPLLVFTRSATTRDRKPPPPAASVLIPQNATKLTLLTAPAGHGRYVMYPITDDNDSLPPGHARLHNLTATRLLVLCNGERQVDLAAGGSALVTGAGKAIVVQVAAMQNDRWAVLFNNVVQISKTQGVNILFIAGQEGAGVGMFILPGWPREPMEPKSDQPGPPAS